MRGADAELKKAVEELDQEEFQRQLTPRGIQWKFNPPAAPHMGGAWERLVQSVKRALEVTLKEVHPREEVLQTVMAEARFTVNCRPLTHVLMIRRMAPLLLQIISRFGVRVEIILHWTISLSLV